MKEGKKILQCIKSPGYAGPDWLASVIKKNHLSLKKAKNLSRPRYNTTKNTFVVYHYFYLLEETISNLGLKINPKLFGTAMRVGRFMNPKN